MAEATRAVPTCPIMDCMASPEIGQQASRTGDEAEIALCRLARLTLLSDALL